MLKAIRFLTLLLNTIIYPCYVWPQSKTVIEASPQSQFDSPLNYKESVIDPLVDLETSIWRDRRDLLNSWPLSSLVSINWKPCSEPTDGIRHSPMKIEIQADNGFNHEWENVVEDLGSNVIFEGWLNSNTSSLKFFVWLSQDKPDETLPLAYGTKLVKDSYSLNLIPRSTFHFELTCKRDPESLNPVLQFGLDDSLNSQDVELGFEELNEVPLTWKEPLSQKFQIYPVISFHKTGPLNLDDCSRSSKSILREDYFKEAFQNLLPLYRTLCPPEPHFTSSEKIYTSSKNYKSSKIFKDFNLNFINKPTNERLEEYIVYTKDNRPHYLSAFKSIENSSNQILVKYQQLVHEFLCKRRQLIENKNLSVYVSLSKKFMNACHGLKLNLVDSWPNKWHCPAWQQIIDQDISQLKEPHIEKKYINIQLPKHYLLSESSDLRRLRIHHNKYRIEWATCLQPELYSGVNKSIYYPSYFEFKTIRQRMLKIEALQKNHLTASDSKNLISKRNNILKNLSTSLLSCRAKNENI